MMQVMSKVQKKKYLVSLEAERESIIGTIKPDYYLDPNPNLNPNPNPNPQT